MNTTEQILRKRIQRLERQVLSLSLTLDRLIADLELTESAGCAFAWDLAQSARQEWLVDDLGELWESALAAYHEREEARRLLEEDARGA